MPADWHLPLPNLQLGVKVTTQKEADRRIPLLLQTPAVKRRLWVEPNEPIELYELVHNDRELIDALSGAWSKDEYHCEHGPRLDHVVIQGDRDNPSVQYLVAQCQDAGVAFEVVA